MKHLFCVLVFVIGMLGCMPEEKPLDQLRAALVDAVDTVDSVSTTDTTDTVDAAETDIAVGSDTADDAEVEVAIDIDSAATDAEAEVADTEDVGDTQLAEVDVAEPADEIGGETDVQTFDLVETADADISEDLVFDIGSDIELDTTDVIAESDEFVSTDVAQEDEVTGTDVVFADTIDTVDVPETDITVGSDIDSVATDAEAEVVDTEDVEDTQLAEVDAVEPADEIGGETDVQTFDLVETADAEISEDLVFDIGSDIELDTTDAIAESDEFVSTDVAQEDEVTGTDVVVVDPCALLNCEDGNICAKDQCIAAQCYHFPESGQCDDGNPCTPVDSCVNGLCVASSVKVCDDNSVCTDDSCDVNTGDCVNLPNTATCTDGDACTLGDQCAESVCVSGVAKVCDDNNVCTSNICSGGSCVYNSISGSCEDGDACTIADSCVNGSCVAGSPKVCDDNSVCTDDSCDVNTGDCVNLPNTATCTDGDACTLGDQCAGNVCVSGVAKVCDDNNVCTDDSCDSNTGACVFMTNSSPCSDANACTIGDVCLGGTCIAGTPKVCDDANVCTSDSCDTGVGECVFTPKSGICSDANACTVGDVCASGVCVAGSPKVCEDNDSCTLNTCKPASGCAYTPVYVVYDYKSTLEPEWEVGGAMQWTSGNKTYYLGVFQYSYVLQTPTGTAAFTQSYARLDLDLVRQQLAALGGWSSGDPIYMEHTMLDWSWSNPEVPMVTQVLDDNGQLYNGLTQSPPPGGLGKVVLYSWTIGTGGRWLEYRSDRNEKVQQGESCLWGPVVFAPTTCNPPAVPYN